MASLKIDSDFLIITSALTDQERGRLMLAMVRYADSGEEEELPGNERILWPYFRMRIDHNLQTAEAHAKAGKNGGRPRKAEGNREEANAADDNQQKPNETKENQTKPNETTLSGEKESEKEKGTQKEKDKEKEGVNEGAKAPCAREDFALFWAAYPNKQDKKKAQEVFARLRPSPALFTQIMDALDKQKRSEQWQKDGGRYIPLPTTWLRGRRWEDQVPVHPPGKTVSAQAYNQRSYTQEEWDAMGIDILAEARQERERMSG